MIVVAVVYAFLIVSGSVYLWFMLASNGFEPITKKQTESGLFATYLIMSLLYLWTVSAFGWILPVLVMIGFSAVSFGQSLYEIANYGGLRYTLTGTIVGTLVSGYVAYSLLSIALGG